MTETDVNPPEGEEPVSAVPADTIQQLMAQMKAMQEQHDRVLREAEESKVRAEESRARLAEMMEQHKRERENWRKQAERNQSRQESPPLPSATGAAGPSTPTRMNRMVSPKPSPRQVLQRPRLPTGRPIGSSPPIAPIAPDYGALTGIRFSSDAGNDEDVEGNGPSYQDMLKDAYSDAPTFSEDISFTQPTGVFFSHGSQMSDSFGADFHQLDEIDLQLGYDPQRPSPTAHQRITSSSAIVEQSGLRSTPNRPLNTGVILSSDGDSISLPAVSSLMPPPARPPPTDRNQRAERTPRKQGASVKNLTEGQRLVYHRMDEYVFRHVLFVNPFLDNEVATRSAFFATWRKVREEVVKEYVEVPDIVSGTEWKGDVGAVVRTSAF